MSSLYQNADLTLRRSEETSGTPLQLGERLTVHWPDADPVSVEIPHSKSSWARLLYDARVIDEGDARGRGAFDERPKPAEEIFPNKARRILKQIGQDVYDMLFPPDSGLAERFEEFYSQAILDGRRVRLRLRLEDEALRRSVPWEAIYACWLETDGSLGRAFCRHLRQMSVVRHVPSSEERGVVTLQTMGLFIAEPTDVPAFQAGPTHKAFEEAFVYKRLQPDIQPRTTWEVLQNWLTGRPNIFHFLGHGEYEDGVSFLRLLSSDGETSVRKDEREIVSALADASSMRLAIFQACQSGLLAYQLVERGVPAAIGMQYSIIHRAADRFTRGLYGPLLDNRSLDGMLSLARERMVRLPEPGEEGYSEVARTGNALVSHQWVLPILVSSYDELPLRLVGTTIRDIRKPLPEIGSFIDREQELEMLKRGLKEKPVALVEGVAGVGKSWLAARLAQELGFGPDQVVWVELGPGLREPAWTVWHWLAKALTMQGYSGLDRRLERERQRGEVDWYGLANLLKEGLEQQELLVILDGLAGTELDQDTTGWETLFEEVQSVDLAGRSRFILLSRDDLIDFSSAVKLDMQNVVRCVLRGLPQAYLLELADLEGVHLSAEDMALVYSKTRGHPGIAKEVLAELARSSGAERRIFIDRLSTPSGAHSPDNALTQFVVDQLEEEEWDTLVGLSVPRRPHRATVLKAVTGKGVDGVDELLSDLQQRHLVEATELGYQMHDTLREVMLGELSVDEEQFKKLNLSWADYYHDLPDPVEEFHHRLQAGDYEWAEATLDSDAWDPKMLPLAGVSTLLGDIQALWDHGVENYNLAMRAGKGAELLGYSQRAIEWYERAQSLAQSAIEYAGAQRETAWVYHRMGRPDASDRAITEARSALGEVEKDATAVHALAFLEIVVAQVLVERYRAREADEAVKRAFAWLSIPLSVSEWKLRQRVERDTELAHFLAEGFRALGWVLGNLNQAREAEHAHERSRFLYAQIGNRWMESVALVNVGWAQAERGDIAGALQSYEEAQAIAAKLGDPTYVRLLTLFNTTLDRRDAGKGWDQVEHSFNEARLLAEQYHPWALPIILQETGRFLTWVGRWDEARETLDEMIRISEEEFDKAYGFFSLAELEVFRVEVGEVTPSAVSVVVERAVQAMEQMAEEDPLLSVKSSIMAAEFALLCGEVGDAEEFIGVAQSRYDDQVEERDRNPADVGKLKEVLARILTAQGREQESRQAFLESLEGQKHVFFDLHTRYHYALALSMWSGDSEAQHEKKRALAKAEELGVNWIARITSLGGKSGSAE